MWPKTGIPKPQAMDWYSSPWGWGLGLLGLGCTAGSEQRANQLRLYLQLLPMAHITSWAQGNKLRAPSDSRYGELYNYFILVVSQCNTNRNKMHNKCNALESP